MRFFCIAAGEALVGGADQDAAAEDLQRFQLLQDLPVLLRRLGETQARVEDPVGDAVFFRPAGKFRELTHQFGDDPVGIVALRVHRAGVAPLVHRDVRETQPADRREHVGIVLPG